MSSRREFLKTASLVSASWMLPNFLHTVGADNLQRAKNGKVLVVIQFSGGNDGLNMVVPYENDLYYKNRPAIGIPARDVYRLTDEQGLHPSMVGLKYLYDEGNLSVINSVGYPNPNRSHFRSMDIWHSASQANEYWHSGWIGRLLDAQCNNGCTKPHMAIELEDTLGLALKGSQTKGLAATNPISFYNSTREPFIHALSKRTTPSADDHRNVTYLHKTLIEATSSAEYVFEKSKVYKTAVDYPKNEFANKLKTIAKLIVANAETKVYYVSLSGFDTHVNQKGKHARLLEQYSEAIEAFTDDLRHNNRFQDTLIMTFSEFGRRVKQNAGKGTDHGTANNLFLISGSLNKPGVYNAAPDLSDLQDGDLKYQIDFRRVYATILNRWLEVDAKEILGRGFEILKVV